MSSPPTLTSRCQNQCIVVMQHSPPLPALLLLLLGLPSLFCRPSIYPLYPNDTAAVPAATWHPTQRNNVHAHNAPQQPNPNTKRNTRTHTADSVTRQAGGHSGSHERDI
mmetsp:Transcript_7107/g.17314  ORF Transcript_7107/g.17314 Transcript_7107/m.17314 type:complete len:109 (+) Transcript_7107:386-712(+)